LLRAPRAAVEGRAGPALVAEHRRRDEAVTRRHAAHRHRGQRPGPHRVLQERAGGDGRAPAAPGGGDGRPRARLPGGLAQHPVLLYPDQGPRQPAARRERHVHGPVGHGRLPGHAAAARERGRARADAAAGREDPGRAGRLPVQGLHRADAGGADAAQDRPAAARHVPGRDDRARPGRHPVDVRPPPRGLSPRMNTYICRYCRQPSDPNSPTCPLCGAPVDIRSSVSDSGWVEQPPIRDMARLQFGQSHVQIEGTTVPTADFTLAPEDWIYFSHHVLLWTEPATQLANMPLKGAWNRKMAGLPLVMVEARGPGHLALSDNHAGELVALPLQHSQQIWVREHRFLCATGNIKYDWHPSEVWYETGQDSDDREMHYPMGRYGDVFGAHGALGLLL